MRLRASESLIRSHTISRGSHLELQSRQHVFKVIERPTYRFACFERRMQIKYPGFYLPKVCDLLGVLQPTARRHIDTEGCGRGFVDQQTGRNTRLLDNRVLDETVDEVDIRTDELLAVDTGLEKKCTVMNEELQVQL